jgi:hypothetical protein
MYEAILRRRLHGLVGGFFENWNPLCGHITGDH